ncbi:tetratricopeptide repeat protein [Sediminitomix flava]|uniref:Tetratricopeptide repeat protein n=1 Tax=Sediminitomix flava TaxID=379075 RepID=A0A316A3U5_SEDFL|nr:tetratricopeptide repeat protein [Sediminitomix flava]PWJ44407.1 tetratricopeptide repeat protein [Sediminitomix flava]
MKHLLAILLLTMLGSVDPTKIARINEYKEAAKEAFLASDYNTAIEKYKHLVYTEEVEDAAVLLNLAHAYYKAGQKDSAKPLYEQLSRNNDNMVKSAAYHQLGMMAVEGEKPDLERSIFSFKEALKADPTNEVTRQNYEIVKKMKEEQDQQQQNQQNQDDQNKDEKGDQDEQNKEQENKENSDQDKENEDSDESKEKEESEKENKEQESDKSDDEKDAEEKENQDQEGKESESEKEQQPEQSEEEKAEEEKQQRMQQKQQRMEEIQMSEDQAKMILEALKNKEQQYYQQLKRKSKKPQNSDRPDW